MIEDVNIRIVQYAAIIGSIIFVAFILELIRRKRIKEEYCLLWLFFGIIFFFLSIWRDSLEFIALTLGIAYAPAALFLILIIAIISILIHFSVVLSRLTENVKNSVQEIGLLKMEFDEMKKGSKANTSKKT